MTQYWGGLTPLWITRTGSGCFGQTFPMTSATEIITGRVRDRVRRDGVDLAGSDGLADRYVREEVQRYSERALGSSLPLLHDEGATQREVVASLTGFGPLQAYLDDPTVEEIWINAPFRQSLAYLRGSFRRSPHRVRRNRQSFGQQRLRARPGAVLSGRPQVAVGVECHRRGLVPQRTLNGHYVAA